MNIDWIVLLIELAVSTVLFSAWVIFAGIKFKEKDVFNYPPDIQKVYFEKHPDINQKEVNGKQRIITKTIAMVVFAGIIILMCWLANCKTFLDGFVFSLIFFGWIAAWDTFFLDWVIFANVKAFRLDGTENMDKEYHQKWFHLKSVLFPAGPIFVAFSAIIGLIVWALPF
ncbi:MAG: hypothetical protein IJ226_04360 [Clostridia bacterium]|nr:hypothetical protein [Clostridia bacterium]